MARKTQRVRVERSEAKRDAAVAGEFARAGTLAREFDYGTASGLLLVHAAIADAVSIHLSGMISTSDNHLDAVALLGEAAAHRKDRSQAAHHLRRLIDEQNRVAYSGESLKAREVEIMASHLERFQTWARSIVEA